MDINSILLSLGTNVFSSMIYDIGKAVAISDSHALSEEQVIEIICSFQDKLNEILVSQNRMEEGIDFMQKQYTAILKLLLVVFCENNKIRIVHTENGYEIEGDYTLESLNNEANICLDHYWNLRLQAVPETLSEAVWPIPGDCKEVLLDEIQQNLYREE